METTSLLPRFVFILYSTTTIMYIEICTIIIHLYLYDNQWMLFFPYEGDETAPETEDNSKSGMEAT